ncbi:MAG TPA: ParA family protein [Ruania sp.]|nr:ParA family protein [Ruania sp.]
MVGTARGATTTTTAVAVATESARAGLDTLLIDLNPNGGASTWLGSRAWERGKDVGAILTDPYPIGWATQLFTYTRWHRRLWCIPAPQEGVELGLRRGDIGHDRLSLALTTTTDLDLVVIDCPPLSPEPLTATALHAASDVVLAVSGVTGDAVEGVGLRERLDTVAATLGRGGPARLRAIVIGNDRVSDRDADETVLMASVPHASIVAETRQSNDYFGSYEPEGAAVARTYSEIAAHVVDAFPVGAPGPEH